MKAGFINCVKRINRKIRYKREKIELLLNMYVMIVVIKFESANQDKYGTI